MYVFLFTLNRNWKSKLHLCIFKSCLSLRFGYVRTQITLHWLYEYPLLDILRFSVLGIPGTFPGHLDH